MARRAAAPGAAPLMGAGWRVCGVDEAGRGPLAGPVVAAAVILDPADPIDGVRDSKRLSALQRERLAEQIRARALAWSVACAECDEIDQLNILEATLVAMRRAIEGLRPAPQYALIDGNQLPLLAIPAAAVVRGDGSVPVIAAASIIAKTHRDALMAAHHRRFPDYGFARHFGYPTAAHLRALRLFGPCPIHRRSFAPVRECIAGGAAPTPGRR
jgi:ribonuclease HII